MGLRYREWDPDAKSYRSGEMSQPILRRYLMATGVSEDDTDRMIRRAQLAGTSEPTDKFNQDGGWAETAAPAATPAVATHSA